MLVLGESIPQLGERPRALGFARELAGQWTVDVGVICGAYATFGALLREAVFEV